MDDLQVPNITFEDQELLRLEKEVKEERATVDKQRKINQLKQQKVQIEQQKKQLSGSGKKFNFNKDKAKFWVIAAVVSIFGAVIIFRVISKFI